jgi:hypothetical protein
VLVGLTSGAFAARRHRRISLEHLRGVPWARIGELVGQRNLESKDEREGGVEVPQLARAEAARRTHQACLDRRPVVCSTRTRVDDPRRSIVGRNDRGGAAVDVGETSTVESASNSSACTTTA